MTISFSRLGNLGRLGNGLFQLASMKGLAHTKGCDLALPVWKYSKYFQGKHPEGHCRGIQVKEPAFHYCGDFIPNDERGVDVVGYLQSPRYWQEIEPEIRKHFEWEPGFLKQVKAKYADIFKKRTIAISCRRGDYIGNAGYELLPAMYYVLCLYNEFPNWKDCNLLFLSDDMDWVKLHFGCLPNAHFAGDFDNKDYFFSETAIEQLCLGSLCDDFIISNSTFGYWVAYLANRGKVVRPTHYLAGKLKQQCDMKDFWPEEWVEFDHKGKKFPLNDVEFTIPVHKDHNDRKQNLDLSVCMIQRDFDTNVIVGEQGGNHFSYMAKWCKYVQFGGSFFHRTRYLNNMARESTKPIICNYDCDILLPPMQVIMAVEAIRSGEADFVYPYDGRFLRLPRNPWFKELENHLDAGVIAGKHFKGGLPSDAISVGGCVFVNREKFFEAGGENENYRNYGNEDTERKFRWETLGYKVKRIVGVLLHVDHFIGPNSTSQHVHGKTNGEEWGRVSTMDKKQLRAYVSTWPWKNQ